MRRSLFAAGVLASVCGGLTLALGGSRDLPPRPATLVLPGRNLPGLRQGGVVHLPNQWSLRPAGRQVLLGDFPVNLALHPTEPWLAVLHSGFGIHGVVVLDLNFPTPKITCGVPLNQTFYGLCWSPDGKTLYASGGEFEVVHAFAFEKGLLAPHPKLPQVRVANLIGRFIPGGIAVDGRHLYAAGVWGHAVALVPLDDPDRRRHVDLEKDSYPYTVLPDAESKKLYVSLWGKAAVAVVDVAKGKVAETWPTDSHPTEMALAPDGKTLFIACSNSTRVDVLDAANHGKPLETLHAALYPRAPSGNTPNSLSLTPDGKTLFVANADANNVAVFNVARPGQSRLEGFIPTGWYPTSVRYRAADKKLYVANGKGLISRPNPQGPNPYLSGLPVIQYIAGLLQGSLSAIDLSNPDKLGEYSAQALLCTPLRRDLGVTAPQPAGNPVPAKVGEDSPIKHCIYVVKENRTYDQVFGDIKEGNGDPNLCLFGEKITPNHHRLARQFVLLDNFYVEGEVSADGHQWTMGAYATDFVEKMWPLTYRGSPLKKLVGVYPSEGHFDAIERPAGGYLWDRCAAAGVSYRSYGEWVEPGRTPKEPGKARVKALEGHFDPWYRGWDLDYPDQKRADRFLEELAGFEKAGEMPRFIVLRLPNDHTSGTRAGKKTPRAQVADNDLALGRVVAALTKSKFWKDTAIFVLEDDAQNGPDHVDAHRSVALVVSPYTKRGAVDSTMYSTSSMLRTMELILGLPPMSQFDAAARPMYAAFQPRADLTPYEHVVPEVDLEETNKAAAWGAKLSEGFDLTHEDAADDLLLNEVIWRSVKGPDSPMPAPVRAALVRPRVKEGDRDDD
jgi:DNA-binding beta-propeller fold protein YncE